MPLLRALIVATLALGIAAGAKASEVEPEALVRGVTGGELAALLESADLPVLERREGGARPIFGSQASGVRFQAEGANCVGEGGRCYTLIFVAGFDVDATDGVRAIADRFNREHYYGRAYLGRRGGLLIDFVADVDGVDLGHLVALTHIWTRLILPDFLALLSGGPALSGLPGPEEGAGPLRAADRIQKDGTLLTRQADAPILSLNPIPASR